MSPFVIFLLQEVVKVTLRRINDSGKYNSLTEDEAKQAIADISAGLSTSLPSPGDLEQAKS